MTENLLPNLILDYSYGNVMNSITTNNYNLSFPAIYGTDTIMTANFANLMTGSLNFTSTAPNTGNASQSGTTVTGSSTSWTAAMVGGILFWGNGVKHYIILFKFNNINSYSKSKVFCFSSPLLFIYGGTEIWQNYYQYSC